MRSAFIDTPFTFETCLPLISVVIREPRHKGSTRTLGQSRFAPYVRSIRPRTLACSPYTSGDKRWISAVWDLRKLARNLRIRGGNHARR